MGLLTMIAVAWGLVAGPAFAHGGDVQVNIGTDGAGGIDATVVWASDGHPVEESVDLVVTAVSDTSEEVGPIRMQSASEGVGWYRSEPGMLGEGHWTVTATMTEPTEHAVSTEIDVVAPAIPEFADEPEPGPETEVPAADVALTGNTAESDSTVGTSWAWFAGGAVALAGLAAISVAVVLRRRKTQ